MWAIELVENRETWAPFPPMRDITGQLVDAGTWVIERLFHAHQVHAGAAADTVIIAPPLTFSEHDTDETVHALSTVLTHLERYCR